MMRSITARIVCVLLLMLFVTISGMSDRVESLKVLCEKKIAEFIKNNEQGYSVSLAATALPLEVYHGIHERLKNLKGIQLYKWHRHYELERPLYYAVCRNDEIELLDLLMVGQNQDEIGDALRKASEHGLKTIVALLLDVGAEVNGKDTNNNYTALHYAARHGRTSITKLLLDCGAEVDALNDSKNTPLGMAAAGGHSDTVTLLVDRGANINQKYYFSVYYEMTILDGAYVNRRSKVMKTLITLGADVNACRGRTDILKMLKKAK